jgi:hypothetical protein
MARASTYAVTDNGIYFIAYNRPGPGISIQFLDSTTGRITRIAPVERPPVLGISISPDYRWLLYNLMEKRDSDLKLVENFR